MPPKVDTVYATADCSGDPVSLAITNFPVPSSTCPFVCKPTSGCVPYVGVDQKPAGTWGLKTTCPSAIGSDASSLFNATSYYGTTQWANATCTDVILGAQVSLQ